MPASWWIGILRGQRLPCRWTPGESNCRARLASPSLRTQASSAVRGLRMFGRRIDAGKNVQVGWKPEHRRSRLRVWKLLLLLLLFLSRLSKPIVFLSTWNNQPSELRSPNISFSNFRSSLLQYLGHPIRRLYWNASVVFPIKQTNNLWHDLLKGMHHDSKVCKSSQKCSCHWKKLHGGVEYQSQILKQQSQ